MKSRERGLPAPVEGWTGEGRSNPSFPTGLTKLHTLTPRLGSTRSPACPLARKLSERPIMEDTLTLQAVGSGDRHRPGYVAPTPDDLAALAQAQAPRPAPARHGRLGLCGACRESVASHWDAAGQWRGCPAATPDTVFVLWPATEGGGHGPTPPPRRPRPAAAFSYHSGRPVGDEDALSPQQREVLGAVHAAGEHGARVKEILARTGLPSGSVQWTLRWLRDQQLIVAKADKGEPRE